MWKLKKLKKLQGKKHCNLVHVINWFITNYILCFLDDFVSFLDFPWKLPGLGRNINPYEVILGVFSSFSIFVLRDFTSYHSSKTDSCNDPGSSLCNETGISWNKQVWFVVLEKIQERVCFGQCNLEEPGTVYGNGRAAKTANNWDILNRSWNLLFGQIRISLERRPCRDFWRFYSRTDLQIWIIRTRK